MTGFDETKIDRDEQNAGFRASLISLLAVVLLLGVATVPAVAAGSTFDDALPSPDAMKDFALPSTDSLAGPLGDVEAAALLAEVRAEYDLPKGWGEEDYLAEEKAHVPSSEDVYKATQDEDTVNIPTGGTLDPAGMCNTIEQLHMNSVKCLNDVRWLTTYPEFARVGDTLTYSGMMANGLDVPIIAEFDYFVAADDVCDVTGTFTGFAVPEIRENVFLLDAKDGNLPTIPDYVSFDLKGAAELEGDCKISVQATILGQGFVQWGAVTMTTEVEEALPDEVDLGTVVAECATESLDAPSDSSAEVEKGAEIDLTLEAIWASGCTGAIGEYKIVAAVTDTDLYDEDPDSDGFAPAVSLTDTGQDKAVFSTDIDDSGFIELEAVMFNENRINGWQLLGCIGAIIGGIAAAAAVQVLVFVAALLAIMATCPQAFDDAVADSKTWTVDISTVSDEVNPGQIIDIPPIRDTLEDLVPDDVGDLEVPDRPEVDDNIGEIVEDSVPGEVGETCIECLWEDLVNDVTT